MKRVSGMPFIEAFRQFQFRVGRGKFCKIHVSLIPNINGEDKSKPTQASVQALRMPGLSPDLVVCRCKSQIGKSIQDKIAMFWHINTNEVLILDCGTVLKSAHFTVLKSALA